MIDDHETVKQQYTPHFFNPSTCNACAPVIHGSILIWFPTENNKPGHETQITTL